jgi:Ca2+/Na+ antiporter
MRHHFRLAPMTIDVLALTLLLLLVPVVILIAMLMLSLSLLVPLLLICLVYAWVWLRFRPSAFILEDDGLEVVWPLKRRRIRRADIRDVHLTDRRALRRDLGWGFRVGAGGLSGSFGWLWTQRRGPVQMYVSRSRDLVWIELDSDRPWLITPERPDELVQLLRNEGAKAKPS